MYAAAENLSIIPQDRSDESLELAYEELQELLNKTSLDLRSVLIIGLKLAEGLALLHEQGIVYKHIHPGSVMVRSDRKRVEFRMGSKALSASLAILEWERPLWSDDS